MNVLRSWNVGGRPSRLFRRPQVGKHGNTGIRTEEQTVIVGRMQRECFEKLQGSTISGEDHLDLRRSIAQWHHLFRQERVPLSMPLVAPSEGTVGLIGLNDRTTGP